MRELTSAEMRTGEAVGQIKLFALLEGERDGIV